MAVSVRNPSDRNGAAGDPLTGCSGEASLMKHRPDGLRTPRTDAEEFAGAVPARLARELEMENGLLRDGLRRMTGSWRGLMKEWRENAEKLKG